MSATSKRYEGQLLRLSCVSGFVGPCRPYLFSVYEKKTYETEL